MTNMKVYVASSFFNKDAVRKAEKTLRDNGFYVTSRWVDHTTKEGNPFGLKEDGIIDLADLLAADVLLVLWPGRLGTASEIGVAIGKEKKVYIVSDGTPIDMPFAYLPFITHIGSIEQFMLYTTDTFFSWQVMRGNGHL